MKSSIFELLTLMRNVMGCRYVWYAVILSRFALTTSFSLYPSIVPVTTEVCRILVQMNSNSTYICRNRWRNGLTLISKKVENGLNNTRGAGNSFSSTIDRSHRMSASLHGPPTADLRPDAKGNEFAGLMSDSEYRVLSGPSSADDRIHQLQVQRTSQ